MVFSPLCFAQQTIGEAIDSADISDILEPTWETMGESQRLRLCKRDYTIALIVMQDSITKLQDKKFDAAWQGTDVAFQHLIFAMNCNDEELSANIESKLETLYELDDRIACAYHLTEATGAYTRSELALTHFDDVDKSIAHLSTSVFSYKEAMRFCGEQYQAEIEQSHSSVEEMMVVLQEYKAEHVDGN